MNLEYLRIKCPEHIEHLVSMGAFNQAREAIKKHMTLEISPLLKQRLEHELLTLDLIERDFVYTRQTLFKALSPHISDLMPSEIDTFESEGYLLWHMVEGEKKYHKRAVKTVLKEHINLRDRLRLEGYEPASTFLYAPMVIDDAIAKMRTKGELSVEMTIKAGVKVKAKSMRRVSKSQDKIMMRFYLSLPRKAHFTRQVKLLEASNETIQVANEKADQRVVYFETNDVVDTFEIKYQFLNHMEYRPLYEIAEHMTNASESAREYGSKGNQRINLYDTLSEADKVKFLAEKSPHILFTPLLKNLAEQVVGSETRPLLKAKRIYDYITHNVRYRFMGSYRMILNLPEYGALNMRGDCGVQSLLFITLLRIVGVPATFASGLTVLPNASIGMHDWSAFYVKPYGWCFADVSYGEGAYRRGQLEKCRFYFGNIDPYRMMSNFDFQVPFEFPKRFMRDDPYDNQVGEVETSYGGLFSDDFDDEIQLIKIREVDK